MGENPPAAIVAMSSSDPDVANRAEWILVKAGRAILPSVREALQSGNAQGVNDAPRSLRGKETAKLVLCSGRLLSRTLKIVS